MKYFVTGASGFIGSGVVKELISQGHTVLGLARSDKSAEAVKALGAEVHRGSLEDLESLKSGAAASDGVAHLGFVHDFSGNFDFEAWCKTDREAIAAMGEALKGTNKPLVVTSGTLLLPAGRLATEDDLPDTSNPMGATRGPSEKITLNLAKEGVRAMVVRLPPTNHGAGDHGFIDMLVKGSQSQSGYVGEGNNVWSAVHRLDSARVFVLALEKGKAGSVYHAVAEQGVPFKTIARAIAEKVGVSTKSLSMEDAQKQFGHLAFAVLADNPVSSEKTRKELGWEPKQPGLLEDIKGNAYVSAA